MSKNAQLEQLGLFPPEPGQFQDAVRSIDTIGGELVGPEPGSDLVESVRHQGLLQPILVKRVVGEGKPYEILDGRRRLKAAKMVGLTEVPIRVVPKEYVHTEVITLQANTARRPNPISEYLAIKSLQTKGFDEKRIAKELGIKAAVVKQRLGLGNLIPLILELVETGRIAVTVAEAVAKLPHPQQEELVTVFATEDKLTMDDVKKVKKVKVDEASSSLLGLLMGDDLTRRQDVDSAKRHLQSFEEIISRLGCEVDLTNLRTALETLDPAQT